MLVLTSWMISPGAADAQERAVRFDGRVQWIAGQLLVVQTSSGASVSVDLVRIPPDQYAVLTPSERVVVIGVITNGSRRVIGTSVMRGETQAP
jgi:hypothetical protein